MVTSIIIIVVLLLLSAFFSGSETALTAASRARMKLLEQEGNPRAAIVNTLLEKRTRLIGTILLGNNLVNILASALATSTLIALVGEAGVVYATAAMTVLVLVFAEILPKTTALMHADKLALAVAPIMRVLTLLLMPFVVTIDWVVQIALRLAGLNQQDGDSAQLALAELRGAIELHGTETDEENTTSTDDKTREERAMLRSVLDLRDVEVSEIMIHRRNIFMLDANMPTQELVQSLLESTYTRIPIYRDTPENVIGILHAKEVLRAIHTHNGDLDAMNLLEHTSAPMFIPETTPLLQQLNAFRSDGRHFAIVVDEYGTMMGIVTLEDILEEIVGDISDETDVHISGIIEETPDYIVVEGQVTIRDLNRRYEWRLSDEDANTIAGLVLYASQRIPEKGQSYLVDGYKITVEKREKNRLTVLRVAPPEDRPIIA